MQDMQELKAIKGKVHEIPTLEDNIHGMRTLLLLTTSLSHSERSRSLAAHRRKPKEGIGALMPLIRSGFPLNEHDNGCRPYKSLDVLDRGHCTRACI